MKSSINEIFIDTISINWMSDLIRGESSNMKKNLQPFEFSKVKSIKKLLNITLNFKAKIEKRIKDSTKSKFNTLNKERIRAEDSSEIIQNAINALKTSEETIKALAEINVEVKTINKLIYYKLWDMLEKYIDKISHKIRACEKQKNKKGEAKSLAQTSLNELTTKMLPTNADELQTLTIT